jgi:hypothetical protein
MSRNPNAPLSPAEWSSLRQLEDNSANLIPEPHETLFLSMGFISFATGKRTVTVSGRARLAGEHQIARSPRASNEARSSKRV